MKKKIIKRSKQKNNEMMSAGTDNRNRILIWTTEAMQLSVPITATVPSAPPQLSLEGWSIEQKGSRGWVLPIVWSPPHPHP